MVETVVYSPLFGIVLSIAAFEAGIWIQKKTRKAICNPLVIAILLCIAVLVLFNMPAYNKGGDIINLFLGPATAVLALNIYNQMDVLKKHFWPVLAGCTAGSITSIGSVFLLCKAFGLDDSITKALLPKSCTTPIAVGIAESQGGVVAITMVAVLLTGLIGALAAPLFAKVFHIKSPVAQGLATGACSHALGTTKALEMGEVPGRDERDFHRRVRDYHGYFVAVFVKRIRAGNRPLDALGPAPGLSPVLAFWLSRWIPTGFRHGKRDPGFCNLGSLFCLSAGILCGKEPSPYTLRE